MCRLLSWISSSFFTRVVFEGLFECMVRWALFIWQNHLLIHMYHIFFSEFVCTIKITIIKEIMNSIMNYSEFVNKDETSNSEFFTNKKFIVTRISKEKVMTFANLARLNINVHTINIFQTDNRNQTTFFFFNLYHTA